MRNLDYSIHYARYHPDSIEHVEQMMDFFTKLLCPMLPAERKSRVIDIGCGYGFALLALKKLGFHEVYGVEVDPQQADRARKYGLEVGCVADTAQWLEKKAVQFSVSILLDVLEHVPAAEQLPLLRSIYERLAVDGRLIVKVPNANSVVASRWLYNDFTHHKSFTEYSLRFILENAGFKEIEFSAGKKTIRPSLRLWRKSVRCGWRTSWRFFLVRWCWRQVLKAELPHENLEAVSFDLDLIAVAYRRD
jgi:SAM-dependent methyltransferase